ncbi:TIGR02147 family protein [Bdellovibrionota bacterium FG-1]
MILSSRFNTIYASRYNNFTYRVQYYIPPAMEGPLSPGYRAQIQRHFELRKASRPAYSLRAFARDLGYGAPQLSRVVNGKQHLSLAYARKLADRLFESDRDRDLFVAQVEYESAATPQAQKTALAQLERAQGREFGEETVILKPEDFQFISDWHHLPILYLIDLQGAPTTIAGIAKYLGICRAETRTAIERLERLQLIRKQGSNWVKTHARLYVPSGKANGAVRKFHRSMIEKAYRAVDAQDVDRRYLSARTIGIAPKDMGKFRALIDDFLAKASVLSSESEHPSKLYQINVQMFDLHAAPSRSPAS